MLEAKDLLRNFLFGNASARDAVHAVIDEHENFSAAHTRGHGNAVKNAFPVMARVWHGLPILSARQSGKLVSLRIVTF